VLGVREPAPSADDFWGAVRARGWCYADTDVLSDDELLELAAGLGPVLISQRGVEAMVSTIPTPRLGDDEVVFHTEDAPAGERVAWVVMQCVAAKALVGGGTALAGADAIVERLDPAELALAQTAVGDYTVFGHCREWRLLTALPGGAWSVDLPPGARWGGGRPGGLGEISIPASEHRRIADRVETVAAEVAAPVEWSPGRVLVFDNRRYLHARLPASAGSRTLRRVLVGPAPAAGAAASGEV
jgi:hypothetical protein